MKKNSDFQKKFPIFKKKKSNFQKKKVFFFFENLLLPSYSHLVRKWQVFAQKKKIHFFKNQNLDFAKKSHFKGIFDLKAVYFAILLILSRSVSTDSGKSRNIDFGNYLIPYTLYRPSPGINRAPIARMKMILIPIESLYKNLQF